jgi:RNA polymerase sigma-70 factor (ECF subfamily)
MKEQEAIARLKQGDIGGLETLVHQYQTQAMRAAYLITRDSALAEDIVQAAFLRVYERIAQFDSSRPFGPWFSRIVVNDAIKAAARRERQVSLEREAGTNEITWADLLSDRQPGPADLAEAAEIRQLVWKALGQLPPKQRAVVVMRYYLGLSESEMVAQLTSPPGTIKWRLHAARARLRALLSVWWSDQSEEPVQ